MTEREFKILFKHYHKELIFYANKLDSRMGGDFVSVAFARLWEIGNHPTPNGFLKVSVKNQYLDYIKSEKRKRLHNGNIAYESIKFIEAKEMQSELVALILNEIESLPTQQKKIANLLKLEFTQVEIAEILHLKPSTIAVQIMRIREKLKLKLKIV